jgi:hypothetical protein
MFCGLLLVLLCFFIWPLCCLFFFDIRILIARMISWNSSCIGLVLCILNCKCILHWFRFTLRLSVAAIVPYFVFNISISLFFEWVVWLWFDDISGVCENYVLLPSLSTILQRRYIRIRYLYYYTAPNSMIEA